MRSARADAPLVQAIARLDGDLRYEARRLARHDRALAADLHQEALICIWQLDPSRFAPTELGYLRTAAVRRMVRLTRREARRGQRFERLGGVR